MKHLSIGYFFSLFAILLLLSACNPSSKSEKVDERPNVLIVISDDQSFAHSSTAGYPAVQTPNFDRVAREGVLFTQGFAASPGCSPSRAALLTGRNCWEIGAAGTHASHFDTSYVTFPDLLETTGYDIGFTGKGWGPGNYKISGRKRNPAGPSFEGRKMDSPNGISDKDYAGNFEDFLSQRNPGKPFYFWMGTHEPHRAFNRGIGLEKGKKLSDAEVPGFLPDDPEIRSDLLDYAVEIEWFDSHLGRALGLLEKAGELENTMVIVTSDNGMAFPRAKANLYEYGFHVPLAIRWPKKVKGGRVSDDLISFADIGPTILEACNVPSTREKSMTGKSFFNLLTSEKEGIIEADRDAIFASRERHSSSRFHSLSYPQRAIRTHDYLYILNLRPERWPAGAPQKYGMNNYPSKNEISAKTLGQRHGGYHDIDKCPSLDFLIENRNRPEVSPYFSLAVDKRPEEELFDIKNDPYCLKNLAEDPAFEETKWELNTHLISYLKETGDRRMLDGGEVWETYPRYSRLRMFPEPSWAKTSPEKVPKQTWREERWANFK